MMMVPSGCFCICQRFGRDIGDMGPGLHFLPSYYRIAYIVSMQATSYDAPVLTVPTSDNVRVNVDVVTVFKIVDASKFIYKLGAKHFDDYLCGTVDEAIRTAVRKEDHTTVYSLRGDRLESMQKLLNEKFEPMGVRFTDFKVTSVWLPDSLANCLETTTKLNKAMERSMRQNEYEMLQIKMESEMAVEQIRRKQDQVLVSEAGRKRRAELEFEQRSVKAEEDGRVALIEAEGKVDVMHTETKGELDRKKTTLETFRIEELSKAQANQQEVKIKADLVQEQAVIEAEAEAERMEKDAGIIKAESGAEKTATRCLVAKRKHEADLREKSILGTLAEKGRFNLIGAPGDRMIKAMMTGKFDKAKL